MKQKEYTQEQITIMKVLSRFSCYGIYNKNIKQEIEQIKKEYDIKEPYFTLREYINIKCCGTYHTFYFILNGIEIFIDNIGDMLTDEYCSLYPLTAKYYVVNDEQKDNGGNCENYHCDHYLTLEIKED